MYTYIFNCSLYFITLFSILFKSLFNTLHKAL